MSVNFNVCPEVMRQINELQITDEQKQIVVRCVGGYSNATWADTVAKIQYKTFQWWNNGPDWQQTVQLLDTRKVHTLPDNGNAANFVVGNVIMAPWIALDYFLQESPTQKLYRLIGENNCALK